MVSLRRKKFKEMAEGAQRRSARLLAIEELKTDKAILALPVDFQQMKDNRKRGRKKSIEVHEETQTFQEAANTNGDPLNSPSSSNNAAKRIIGYILDMLEVKDTLDLFSMPENLQTYDYEESMSKPCYFATLRQKFMDGMYISLDQFENDVLTLFRKAVDSNSPDSTPYREATSMRDEARKIFQSLRNNFTYAELELSNWHQNYFRYKRRTVRNDANVGISNHTSRTSSQRAVSNDMKRRNGTSDVPTNGRQRSWKENKTIRRSPQSRASARPRGGNRGEAATEGQHPKSPDEQRRCSYKPASDPNGSLFTLIPNQPMPLVFNRNSLSYQESLRLFVKDAGPAAKFIAERMCIEYAQRVNPKPIWKPPPFGSPSKIGALGQPFGGSNSSAFGNYGPGCSSPRTSNSSPSNDDAHGEHSEAFEYQSCPLETNMLLTLCSCIGKPDFLERSSAALNSKQDLGLDSKWRFNSFLEGMGVTRNVVRPMPRTGTGTGNNHFQIQSQQTIHESPIWQQQRLVGLKPRLVAEASSSTFSAARACYPQDIGSSPWKPINLND